MNAPIKIGIVVTDGEWCDAPDCEDCSAAALRRMAAEDDADEDTEAER